MNPKKYRDVPAPKNSAAERRAQAYAAPRGWFKAACAARDEAATLQHRIDDNERRRKYGLPEYLP